MENSVETSNENVFNNNRELGLPQKGQKQAYDLQLQLLPNPLSAVVQQSGLGK